MRPVTKADIVHRDGDLYTSAMSVLAFVEDPVDADNDQVGSRIVRYCHRTCLDRTAQWARCSARPRVCGSSCPRALSQLPETSVEHYSRCL